MVVDEDAESGSRCETILSKLRFAVAPARGLDEALRIIATIHPDLIVARAGDASRLRSAVPPLVPVVVTPDGNVSAETLVDEIRKALRARPTGGSSD
jgi:hypothetical protein